MSQLSGSQQPASVVRTTTEQSTVYNNMAVLIDGSAASGKAFDTMLYFARTFNGRGAQDRVSVLHAFDSHADAAGGSELNEASNRRRADTVPPVVWMATIAAGLQYAACRQQCTGGTLASSEIRS